MAKSIDAIQCADASKYGRVDRAHGDSELRAGQD